MPKGVYKRKPFTKEHRENLSKWQKGKHHSPNTEFKKGNVPWDKWIKRIDIVKEKNGNWKGGITTINEKLRKAEEYIIWRWLIFERDNYTCQECGNKGCYISAHHIKPFATNPKLRLVMSNGVTLCRKCHSKKPKGKEIYKLLK